MLANWWVIGFNSLVSSFSHFGFNLECLCAQCDQFTIWVIPNLRRLNWNWVDLFAASIAKLTKALNHLGWWKVAGGSYRFDFAVRRWRFVGAQWYQLAGFDWWSCSTHRLVDEVDLHYWYSFLPLFNLLLIAPLFISPLVITP